MFARLRRYFTGNTGMIGMDGAPGPRGPQGPEGPMGAPGMDWSRLTPTWTPVAQVPDTTRPRPAHPGDAGADLYAYEQAVIPPHSMVKVRTGWSVSLQPATVGDVRTRSSMATKGLVVANSPGTVDTGYNGEVLVALHNVTDRQQMVFRGDKIAQFVTLPVVCAGDPVNPADRADGGFGSTDTDVFMDRIRQTAQDLGEVSPVPHVEIPPQTQWGPQHWAENDLGVSVVPGPTEPIAVEFIGDNWVRVRQANGSTVEGKVTDAELTRLQDLAKPGFGHPHPADIYSPDVAKSALDAIEKTVLDDDDQDDVDMVNHPPHYQNHDIFPGECIDYTESMTFIQGNAFKYVWRWNSKGDSLENLDKAIFYCQHGAAMVNRDDRPSFWEEQHDTADRLSDALSQAEGVATASPEAGLSALELDVASSALYIVYGMPASALDILERARARFRRDNPDA